MKDSYIFSKDWHPDLTEEQILFALSKDIYEPVGIEYQQFLMELGLDPYKKKPQPPKEPIFIPKPQPPRGPTITSTGQKVPDNIGKYSPIEQPTDKITNGFGTNKPTKTNIDLDPTVAPGSLNAPEVNQPVQTQGVPSNITNNPNIPTVKEITEALAETLAKDEENYLIRITKKYKNKLSKFLLGAAIVATLASGFNVTDNIIMQRMIDYSSHTRVQYDIEQNTDIEKMAYKIISDLDMGDLIYAKEGLTLNTNSRLDGVNKTFGKEFTKENKLPGDYAITGFSIVKDGEIVEYIENFNNEPLQKNLGCFIDETLKTHNLTIDDVNIRIHLGSSADKTRGGWCDVSDIITEDYIQEQAIESTKYKGTISNFESNSISLQTLNGKVTIPVKDDNGNFIANGTKVTGSDGREYIINNLKVDTITEKNVTEKEIVNGTKITFDITDCELLKSVLPLIASLAYAKYIDKENKKFKREPHLESFKTEEEYKDYKREFENAKEEYEKKSKFSKVIQKLNRIFIKKREDQLQELNDEQKEKITYLIKKYQSKDYTYSPSDQINIKHGKIIITKENGMQQDITELMMQQINEIGMNNPIVTTGILTEELKEGKKR